MQRLGPLFSLIFLLLGCTSAPQPTSQPIETESPAAGQASLAPEATPVPLEPWNSLHGKGFAPASVKQVTALWTGTVLKIVVEGDMPSPCHRLRASVRPNTPPAIVDVRLFLQEPPEGQDCLQVLTDYTVEITVQPQALPMQVLVNGQPASIAY